MKSVFSNSAFVQGVKKFSRDATGQNTEERLVILNYSELCHYFGVTIFLKFTLNYVVKDFCYNLTFAFAKILQTL